MLFGKAALICTEPFMMSSVNRMKIHLYIIYFIHKNLPGIFQWSVTMWSPVRADSRLAPSQWEMLLQSNTISHWLGTNLESVLSGYINVIFNPTTWVWNLAVLFIDMLIFITCYVFLICFCYLNVWQFHVNSFVNVPECLNGVFVWQL